MSASEATKQRALNATAKTRQGRLAIDVAREQGRQEARVKNQEAYLASLAEKFDEGRRLGREELTTGKVAAQRQAKLLAAFTEGHREGYAVGYADAVKKLTPKKPRKLKPKLHFWLGAEAEARPS